MHCFWGQTYQTAEPTSAGLQKADTSDYRKTPPTSLKEMWKMLELKKLQQTTACRHILMSWVETFSPPETKNRTQHDATRQLHLIKGRLQTFPVQTAVSIKLCMFVLQSIWSTLYNVLHSQVSNWAKSSSLLDSKNSWCQPCYLTLGITHTITAYFCRTNPFSTPPFQQVRCLWFQISTNEVGTVDIFRPGKCCLQQGALHTVQEVVSNPQLSNPAAHWFIVEIRKAVFINPH